VRATLAGWAAVAGLALSILMVVGPTFAWNPISAIPVLGRLSPFRGMLLVVVWLSILSAYGMDWLMRVVRGLSRKHGRLPVPGAVAAWALFGIALALIPVDFGPSAAAYVTSGVLFHRRRAGGVRLVARTWHGRAVLGCCQHAA
jgi:hypothetical protein